jgi:apolipoprotein N-acyltransferase
MSKKQKYLLAVSSGLLLWLAWPPLPFFPLLFIAFVPVLWLEDACSNSTRSARSFFGYSYLALLIWNIFTTWWVGATVLGTKDISTAIAGLWQTRLTHC